MRTPTWAAMPRPKKHRDPAGDQPDHEQPGPGNILRTPWCARLSTVPQALEAVQNRRQRRRPSDRLLRQTSRSFPNFSSGPIALINQSKTRSEDSYLRCSRIPISSMRFYGPTSWTAPASTFRGQAKAAEAYLKRRSRSSSARATSIRRRGRSKTGDKQAVFEELIKMLIEATVRRSP